MLRKIEKIQRMVNTLLGQCTDALTGTPRAESQKQGEEKWMTLGEMILKAQDGVLTPRSMRELSRWISHDEGALRYYVDFQHLTVLLRQHFRPEAFSRDLAHSSYS